MGGRGILGQDRPHRPVALPDAGRPPAVLVGEEDEALGVEPGGLDDGHVGAAGDLLGGARDPVDEGREVRDRAVPGHLRVLPADPREAGAVGADPGVGDEAVAGGDLADRRDVVRGGAVQRDGGDVALDVRGGLLGGAGAGVVLADPPDLAGAVGKGHGRGAGPAQGGAVRGVDLKARWGQGAGLLTRDQEVGALVVEMDEDDVGEGSVRPLLHRPQVRGGRPRPRRPRHRGSASARRPPSRPPRARPRSRRRTRAPGSARSTVRAKTVTGAPPSSAGPGVRTTAWRPPSAAMPSVHHSWSPTNCGPPRRVPPWAIDAALIGEGQEPYARVLTMRPG